MAQQLQYLLYETFCTVILTVRLPIISGHILWARSQRKACKKPASSYSIASSLRSSQKQVSLLETREELQVNWCPESQLPGLLQYIVPQEVAHMITFRPCRSHRNREPAPGRHRVNAKIQAYWPKYRETPWLLNSYIYTIVYVFYESLRWSLQPLHQTSFPQWLQTK